MYCILIGKYRQVIGCMSNVEVGNYYQWWGAALVILVAWVTLSQYTGEILNDKPIKLQKDDLVEPELATVEQDGKVLTHKSGVGTQAGAEAIFPYEWGGIPLLCGEINIDTWYPEHYDPMKAKLETASQVKRAMEVSGIKTQDTVVIFRGADTPQVVSWYSAEASLVANKVLFCTTADE